ncbi:MAG: ADP-ribosylglycohydrolase family protein [Bacteroidota bacterium]
MKKTLVLSIIYSCFLLLSACEQPIPIEDQAITNKHDPTSITKPAFPSKSVLYDKILGMLVGSAIGDAMGAPTEMWSRYNIQTEFGFVHQLDDMIRAPSPEGTWQMNLPAGGTTDDTRWKGLLTKFILQEGQDFYQAAGTNPYHFAAFIVEEYQKKIKNLKETNSFEPAPFETALMQMSWLQEWAMVARPFSKKDLEGYSYALNHFYGGEPTCAGMLYAPMVGLVYPDDPASAYQSAYRLGIFDLGYARDITGLTAAMTAAAMAENSTPENIISTLQKIDPNGYFESRLVGRSAQRFYQDALYAVTAAKKMTKKDIDLGKIHLPYQGKDTLYFAQLQYLFDALDAKNEDMAFHPGEIHQINLTALLFTNFDFQKSLEFVVNYGRDNDTVAAITGAILGAMHGYEKLPKQSAEIVLSVNKEQLGIDLELMAQQLTAFLIQTERVTISDPTSS